MLVAATQSTGRKFDSYLPCEFIFGNHDRFRELARDGPHHLSLNPCSNVSNLSIKIADFQEAIRDAMPVLKNSLIGIPVDCSLSQSDFDALMKSLRAWESQVTFMLGAIPDWRKLNDNPSANAIDTEVKRILALIQTGRRTSSDHTFIKFGFIGCVSVLSSLAELRVACLVAKNFTPISPVIVVSYAGCRNVDLIQESFTLIEATGCASRVIMFVPSGPMRDVVLSTHYKKILNVSSYDVQDPFSGENCCFWPNEGCCRSYFELRELMDSSREEGKEGKLARSSGVFFRSDHVAHGGLGFRGRLELKKRLESGIKMCDANFAQFDWKPPFVKEAPKAQFRCDVCRNEFPLDTGEEPYRKFDFVYCSMSCLSTHRKQGWAPVDR
eukprot:Gregarina_sp_Poly_1__4452@NODE_239_length_10907_cov_182_631458_g210_i0_p4_GENE_NODE_239_length_10907_cov_182_631458_g210_i0NODE_239_length_10907_cov_182_631458_g210_i0_p4_ORF_typecomplete_len383_score45_55VATC/PF18716_1/1_7e10DUF3330/PF11809_8/0_028_NODE_239_length_10907_cov_182_631458_g210_i069258073